MRPEGLAAGRHVGSQGESSSVRSKSTTRTPRWEHTRHLRRAGPTVSEENETGMGGEGCWRGGQRPCRGPGRCPKSSDSMDNKF